jgi:hypothetical protein
MNAKTETMDAAAIMGNNITDLFILIRDNALYSQLA